MKKKFTLLIAAVAVLIAMVTPQANAACPVVKFWQQGEQLCQDVFGTVNQPQTQIEIAYTEVQQISGETTNGVPITNNGAIAVKMHEPNDGEVENGRAESYTDVMTATTPAAQNYGALNLRC